MPQTNKNTVIFYGTQTGTAGINVTYVVSIGTLAHSYAEEFAERLVKQGKKYGFRAMTADPEVRLTADDSVTHLLH